MVEDRDESDRTKTALIDVIVRLQEEAKAGIDCFMLGMCRLHYVLLPLNTSIVQVSHKTQSPPLSIHSSHYPMRIISIGLPQLGSAIEDPVYGRPTPPN